MAENRFAKYVTQAAPTGDPVIARDPYKQASEARARAAEARANADQAMQADQFRATQGNTVFTQKDKLRSDFSALPDVKEYRQAIKSYASALKTENNPAGDLNLIYAFAKIMDPNSVVREGEAATVAGGDTLYGQTVARLKKEMGADGSFRPEYREELRNELQTRIEELNRSYNTQRQQFERYAQDAGLDPAVIIGEHDGDLFKPDIEAARLKYHQAQDGGLGADEGPPEGQVLLGYGKNADGAPYPIYGAPGTTPPVDGNSPGWSQIGAGVGDIVEGGLNSTVGLIANPINTVIGRAAGYDNYTADLGQSARDFLGLPEGNGTIGAINQAASGVGALGALARGATKAVTSAPVRNALSTLADQPISNMLAGGASAAASEGARQGGYGPAVQAGAALAGGVTGYGAGRAVNALTQPRTVNPVMQAADDLNVTMMPADVGGGGTRLASGVVRRTLGEVPLAEGARESLRTGANARDRVASNIGRVSDETGAGQAAQRGAKDFIAKSETRGDELYEKISIPPEAQAQTTNTRTALAEITKTMESNPELSKLWTGNERLQKTLEALTPKEKTVTTGPKGYPAFAKTRGTGEFEGGTVSWEDFKRLRSIVGEIAGSPSLSSDGAAIKAMKKFYGALSKDMEATAEAAGPRALTEFKRANQYWRGRESRIETVLSSILGDNMNKGEAAAFEQINRWSQQKGGDFKRLAQAMRSMGPDEANEVRATLLGRMGTASKGRQNADGNEFSPSEFVTQWNGLSPRAKSMLFPDAAHRKDIGKLVTVMDGMKRAGEYANTSMTSLGTNAVATAGVAWANPFVGAIYAGMQFGAGKLLASPKFARWVSSIPANPSAGAQKHLVRSLSSVAAKDPTIKAEVIQLSDYLRRSVNASPTSQRAAAEEERAEKR